MKSFDALYKAKLQEFDEKEDLYSKLLAYYRASTEILSISQGKEGVDLLVMSDRIQGDLKLCLEKSEPLNLIIREFVPFPVENELRGFVWKNRLTALSQYNNVAYLPNMSRDKQAIEKKVRSCMEKFITAVGEKLENFVVDIVLDNDGKVWIVEINPFGELAGSCLFSWIDDRELLLNEDGRFEFRVQDTPPGIMYIKGQINERLISFLNI